MYWIEVDFSNGKKVRREYDNMNDSYAVLRRYNNGRNRPDWNVIRAGVNDKQTGEWIKK